MADFLTEFRYRGIDNSDGGTIGNPGESFHSRVSVREAIGQPSDPIQGLRPNSGHAHPLIFPHEPTIAGLPSQIDASFIQGSKDLPVEDEGAIVPCLTERRRGVKSHICESGATYTVA